MTLARLVRRNVARHPVRASLTFAFAALAIFLVVFLRSVVASFDEFVAKSRPDRLMVQSAVATFGEMPASYTDAVAQTEGVESVSRVSWFGGAFRDPKDFFPKLAVDMEVFFREYPEVVLTDEEKRAALEDRRACVIGRQLADQYGFSLGDTIPVQGTLYPRDDGRAWEFVVRGIFRSTSPAIHEKLMLLRWDHFDEVRRAQEATRDLGHRVTFLAVKVARGHEPSAVMDRIDARYAGGPVRTLTQTEAQFRQAFLSMVGNVTGLLAWIGGGVVFAILLAVANAAGIAARERTRESGILSALGFPPRTAARLLQAETVLVVGSGGLAGLAASHASVPFFRGAFGMQLPNYFVLPETSVLAAALAVGIGFAGGLLPALRLGRIRAAEVLRDVE